MNIYTRRGVVDARLTKYVVVESHCDCQVGVELLASVVVRLLMVNIRRKGSWLNNLVTLKVDSSSNGSDSTN